MLKGKYFLSSKTIKLLHTIYYIVLKRSIIINGQKY